MLLEPDVVQNLWDQGVTGIGRHGVNMIFESDVELALDLVKVDVGVDSFAKVLQIWIDRARYELPGNHARYKNHHCDDPSYEVHCVGVE
jgi:hypothetical protein